MSDKFSNVSYDKLQEKIVDDNVNVLHAKISRSKWQGENT